MRWLVFGDVHGNLPALEQLLFKEKGNYDRIICHGDVVNYAPWGNECVQLLAGLENSICLKGNHEAYFIEGAYPGTHPVAKAFFSHCYPRFREFQPLSEYGLSSSAGVFLVQHTLLDKYIFEDTDIHDAGLTGNFIIGHSHQQYERILPGLRLINTGSLGQNRAFINVADYLIYDDISEAVELKHFIYDIESVISAMEAEGYNELCLNYYRNKRRA